MRIITLHCDYIKFQALKKALNKAEELSHKDEVEVKEPLVVLTAVEKGDGDKTIKELVDAVEKTAAEVKAKNIVLYPYAHLSSKLAAPELALEIMQKAEKALAKEFKVTRAPFGYYKTFELKVKGHPLSELSKEFVEALGPEENKGTDVKEYDISKLLKEISRSKLDTSKLKENDHRILGQKLDLFSFNEAAPGCAFFHPNGQIIFNELVRFSKEIQAAKGYQEVSAPQILDTKLWKVSGHWDHYKDNMFMTKYENREEGVKPMNCPGHMLLFRTKMRSYKDLPIRYAEYSPLHRMELSGVLAGLFRVIKFHQDDSHIFCTLEQLEDEVKGVIDLIKMFYLDTFGFKDLKVKFSTRPEKFMGEKKDWDKAEEALERVLKAAKLKYTINKGDGAFYGPKIDFDVTDSLGRSWQCPTIQLDMQLPKRFELKYTGADNKEHTPLVIHRAIYGSLERFIGVLLEHLNGNLPVWLSPVQVRVISFTDRNMKSAEKLVKDLREKVPSIRVDSDLSSTTVNDKVRQAEILRIPYIIVIGDKEEESKTLAVRSRGEKPKFKVKEEDFVKELKEKIENRK